METVTLEGNIKKRIQILIDEVSVGLQNYPKLLGLYLSHTVDRHIDGEKTASTKQDISVLDRLSAGNATYSRIAQNLKTLHQLYTKDDDTLREFLEQCDPHQRKPKPETLAEMADKVSKIINEKVDDRIQHPYVPSQPQSSSVQLGI